MSREKTREESSRGNETRKSKLNLAMYQVYQDPLWVDFTNKPENMTYHWMAFSVLNEPHQRREIEAIKLGFTPVPASRHPERMPKYSIHKDQLQSEYVQHAGLLLCEIETETYEAMQRHNMININKMTQGLAGHHDAMSDPFMSHDPRMPYRSFSKPENIGW